MNLTSDYTMAREAAGRRKGRARLDVQVTHRFTNDKDAAVSIEVRHAVDGTYGFPEVLKSSQRAGRKYGDLAWRFIIPPGAQESLSYELRATELP
jgi:hypothetical protein